MAGQKLKSARALAVEVLDRCDPARDNTGKLLDTLRHETDQKQRATDLVFGTLRNRMAIDTVICAFSGRPVERIQPKLLNIIRVATYELIYRPSTGQYAIVNEAVLNANVAGTAKQAGFVNAVLRQIARHIDNRLAPRLRADATRTLFSDSATGCWFDTSFLPDSKSRPAEWLSVVFSLPQWLITGWLDEFGEESALQICLASNRRPSVYIRPNPLRTTIEALTEKLTVAEVGFRLVPEAGMIRIENPGDVTRLPGFAEGLFTVQDITASEPVRMLIPQNAERGTQHEKFLDLCAAPGAKTTQLAERTADKAEIIATDIDDKRLEMIKQNITRLGIKSVVLLPYDELLSNADSQIENRKSKIENRFDSILLDVPCSNTGVLARRVEVRYRIGPGAVKKLARIQAGLLDTAGPLVKPGGKICYSTCSIQKEENEKVVENFLRKYGRFGNRPKFTLEKQLLTLPSADSPDHDGGYAAILVKR